ncbi:hypothetical protein GCM10007276_07030 [Agaricicola taiwanensis]|uniref:Uncharacterized protein n=1 Tax=Agaricicola taiwanensis TaxID=591372 RepID=A0A8J2VP44_9RHOB|nr:hypothetical protein GCM10007276_07030 [Agaricicola taiwanensis]
MNGIVRDAMRKAGDEAAQRAIAELAHERNAGFRWALENDITTERRCTERSINHAAGCREFVQLQKFYRVPVINAVETFKDQGMSGLEILSRDCRRKNGTAEPLCVYIDQVGLYVDATISAGLGFPPHAYFTEEAFLRRSVPVLKNNGLSAVEPANSYLRDVHRYVTRIVDMEMGW